MIFAIAIAATLQSENRVVSTGIGISCNSEEEAVGIGIREAKKFWPQSEGYSQHQAAGIHLKDEWLLENMGR